MSAILTGVKRLSVRFTGSSVAARFFNPQLGSVGATDKASPTNQLQRCRVADLRAKLLSIPGANAGDADKDPNRVAPHSVFMMLGVDRLFTLGHEENYGESAGVTAINAANKFALYKFLSTFSGTHYVTPRSVIGELAFRF